MTDLTRIMRIIWLHQRRSLLRGIALAVTVLVAGVALLGLSGWFITAAGAAGLAGLGAAFNVFQPSAAVRMLALGRTAARYGERLLTHDATLRSLTEIRVQLLAGILARPFASLSRLRSAETLNRLVADVDALDGIALRVFIPAIAALTVWGATFAVLAWLTDLWLALWVVGGFAIGVTVTLAWAARKGRAPSRRAEAALQAFRIRLLDLLRARDDLLVYGRLPDQTGAVGNAEIRLTANLRQADRTERQAGLALSAVTVLVAGGALLLGARLAGAGAITPAQAALAFFAALALAETAAPLRRGLADLGRMQDAARRVSRLLPKAALAAPAHVAPSADKDAPALEFRSAGFRHPGAARPVLTGFSLSVAPGATIALTGASGGGKSTILALAAGLLPPDEGDVRLFGRPITTLSEPDLRAEQTLLPQRSAILGISFFDVLALARPDLTDAEARTLLRAVVLDEMVQARGGLHAALHENGAGLSGGEQRRLALARALARRPKLLLLDEPTEGLDRPTAAQVLAGVREILPDATILVASHRAVEQHWAGQLVPVRNSAFQS